MIPNLVCTAQTYAIASRLHVARGRPTYAGRVCAGLVAVSVVWLVTWAALDTLDRAELPDC